MRNSTIALIAALLEPGAWARRSLDVQGNATNPHKLIKRHWTRESMKLRQAAGLVLIVVGILIAFYGIAIIPLGLVLPPGIEFDGRIGPRSAASIGVGAFLILVGAYLLTRRNEE